MPEIYTFTRADKLASNCYALFSGTEYCVIDPSISLSEIKRELNISEAPKFVLLTHEHLDHLWEVDSYVSEGVDILCSKECAENIKNAKVNCSIWICGKEIAMDISCVIIQDGDKISVGNESISVLSTKGHSAGSFCYIGSGYCFTGDVLFAKGSYGRYDLPGGCAKELFSSIEALFQLDENTVIYPGHGPTSEISQTKLFFKI